MDRSERLTEKDIKDLFRVAPSVIRKAFNMVLEKQREIANKKERLREELERGARKNI